MSANGDIMVGEMRLRVMMAQGADTLAAELDSVLGTAWDEALEMYRDGGRRRRSDLAQPGRRLSATIEPLNNRRFSGVADTGMSTCPCTGRSDIRVK